ncbi:MAG: hypothetical protein P4L84_28925 [Isosphaeraceae bacterium]|nr:hypothetical protein [Isosphaeraceae bacterium]
MAVQAPLPSSASSDALFDPSNASGPTLPPTPATVETSPPIASQAPPFGETEAAGQVPETPPAGEENADAPGPPKSKGSSPFGHFFKRSPAPPKAQAERLTPESKTKRRRRRAARVTAPSWGVSFLIHLVILGALGAMTFSTEVRNKILNIDSAMVANPGGADELVHIYADPSNQPRNSAVGGGGSSGGPSNGAGGGGGTFGGIGTGAPSATPSVNGGGGGINEKNGLPGIKSVPNVSGLSLLPSAGSGNLDLGGGGMIAGDVTYGTKDIGEALDQLAREILRHLSQHKLTVVWLFDESESMKDDQKTIRQKFDRVSSELKAGAAGAARKKDAAPLNHVIVGYGKDIHYEVKKPTADIDQIGHAIER